jgi:hypothetical protein
MEYGFVLAVIVVITIFLWLVAEAIKYAAFEEGVRFMMEAEHGIVQDGHVIIPVKVSFKYFTLLQDRARFNGMSVADVASVLLEARRIV